MVFIVLNCGAIVTSAHAQNVEPAFLTTINDIPLMPGLQELEDEALVFDKPGGRIVETTAAGAMVTPAQIEQFYSKTLPQLGWARVSPNHFVRQGEALNLDVSSQNEYGLVHFSVKPQ
jgi:hypothetical protein